ncbi:MAG: hypothetical protein WC554_12710, partial [Clostridia bacterium]
MKNLIIIGARGFGREVLQYVEDYNRENIKNQYNGPLYIDKRHHIKGFLDDDKSLEEKYNLKGYHILSSVYDYKIQKDDYFICAIGDSYYKEKIYNYIKG